MQEMRVDVMRESDMRRIIKEELAGQLSELSEKLSNITANSTTNATTTSSGDGETKTKNKRSPSKWNLFLKECIPTQDKELPMGDKMKACGAEYRSKKDSLTIGEDGKLHGT